jgi:hypothetical protein
MLRRLLGLVVVVGASFAVLILPAGADAVFPRGSRIGLAPPAGFSLSHKLIGFEDEGHGAAITLLDLPGPAYEAFEKAAFSGMSKTFAVEKREMFAFQDGFGFLLTGREMVNGTAHRSWYLLANTTNAEIGHLAALIAVRVPEAAAAAYPDSVIRAALATVTFRSPPVEETLSMLPYKLSALAGFRVSQVMPQAGTVVLTEGAGDLASQPYIVVSIGRGAPELAELRPKFSQDLILSVPLRDLSITSGEPMRINSQQGFEVRAKATGPAGKPVSLVQWLQFGSNSVFTRIVAVVETDHWDETFTRFREVRDGIERR